MNLFETLRAAEYGELHVGHDAATGMRALVAIHDTRLGPSLGGCRFIPYADEAAAIGDVLRLARAMTAKAALAGVPHGGGKAVMMRPAGAFDRPAMFRAFGRFVDHLGGRYLTTEDSGTGTADIEVVRGVTAHALGHDGPGGSGDPSPFTALGTRRGIEACAKVALGRDDLEGLHVAVQGVGNVGGHLCRELAALGARLTVADVREEMAQALADQLGARVVPTSEIHAVPCDVFAPCALGGAIHPGTVDALQCRIVAGAANNQLADDHMGARLSERGVLYAPDYAINAGGLINVAQEVAGYDEAPVRAKTMRIYDTVRSIAERSLSGEGLPHQVADQMVAQILAQAA